MIILQPHIMKNILFSFAGITNRHFRVTVGRKLSAIAILVFFSAFAVKAQPVYVDRIGFKLESIADIDIGWMKIYKPSGPPKAKQLENRSYSARQIGDSQKFMEWMQQSYLPKGCLGDVGYYQNYIPKFSGTNSRLGNEINTHARALPHLYGAQSRMYMFLKKDAQGKFVPQNNMAEYWRIEANQLQYISFPVSFISSTEDYFFVLPDYASQSRGYEEEDKAMSTLRGFDQHPGLALHKHFYIPPKTVSDHAQFVVIMTKNHELPFEKITIGQFLTLVEKKLPVWQKFDPVPGEQYEKAQRNFTRIKEKYRSRWNDIAELGISETDINLYSFVNAGADHHDLFDHSGKGGAASFPIMKVNQKALELCKTDTPQWLVIRWTLGMPREPFNMHLHESILSNFNFEYAYNYFYDPGKISGPYTSVKSPRFTQEVEKNELSSTAKKYAADPNTHFFDDFSSTVAGKVPVDWKSTLSAEGTKSMVVQPAGAEGNWTLLTGDCTITPMLLKKPLPENFTLSFDLAASKEFTWGAKAMSLRLSKKTSAGNEESFLIINLRPGFDGRDGETRVETKFPFPPGYSNETKWLMAPGFSNNKIFNRISVTIKKSGEQFQVLVDDKELIKMDKAVPAAHLFNALSFSSLSSGDTNKYYISNIRIIKN